MPIKDIILTHFANWITPLTYNPAQLELKNKILRKCGIHIGKDSGIDRGFSFIPGTGSFIKIKDHVIIGFNLNCLSHSHIEIGDFCTFAANVSLVSGSHDVDSLEPFPAPLKIGRGCWIGFGAKIVATKKEGLVIGDNAVIGAGSLVIHDVPSSAVVAGTPARILRYRKLPDKVWHLGDTHFNPHTFKIE
jgi:maltose O-acetyltransferase